MVSAKKDINLTPRKKIVLTFSVLNDLRFSNTQQREASVLCIVEISSSNKVIRHQTVTETSLETDGRSVNKIRFARHKAPWLIEIYHIWPLGIMNGSDWGIIPAESGSILPGSAWWLSAAGIPSAACIPAM